MLQRTLTSKVWALVQRAKKKIYILYLVLFQFITYLLHYPSPLPFQFSLLLSPFSFLSSFAFHFSLSSFSPAPHIYFPVITFIFLPFFFFYISSNFFPLYTTDWPGDSLWDYVKIFFFEDLWSPYFCQYSVIDNFTLKCSWTSKLVKIYVFICMFDS